MESGFLIRFVLVFLLLRVVVEANPPGPRRVRCMENNRNNCQSRELYCPIECPLTCLVDCDSCQAVCDNPPQPFLPPPIPFPRQQPFSPPPQPISPPEQPCPPPPPEQTISPPEQPFSPPQQPFSPPQQPLSPPPPQQPFSPPPPQQPFSPPEQPISPPPRTQQPYSPPPPITYPPPDTRTRTPPVSAGSPPAVSPSGLPDWWGTGSCMNRNYPSCYRIRHNCPAGCPTECMVDCVTCSPVCQCDRPGTVCQDPKFVGADGLTFYFHGKKDRDFCIVSDPNLHINAHFIGKRNPKMTRDFTWVQSLGILFNNHKLIVGANKTAVWDESIDRIYLSFDQNHVELPVGAGSTWSPKSTPTVSITRTHETNGLVIEVKGIFKINLRVVPITKTESKVHKYEITKEDCFAHLDLGFKFYALSGEVNGILGQTYATKYVSKVRMGTNTPVLGGDKEFSSTNLLSTDCKVSRFNASSDSTTNSKYTELKCSSGIDGRGVICKR